jgi:hypothetical protein
MKLSHIACVHKFTAMCPVLEHPRSAVTLDMQRLAGQVITNNDRGSDKHQLKLRPSHHCIRDSRNDYPQHPSLALEHLSGFSSSLSFCITVADISPLAPYRSPTFSVTVICRVLNLPRPEFASSSLVHPPIRLYYTPHFSTRLNGRTPAYKMSPIKLLLSALARRDGGSGNGSTVSSDSLGSDWWWTSPIAYAIKWGIIAGIFVLFLAFFLGGYLHAQRRMSRGLPPLAYHRVCHSQSAEGHC